MYFARTVKSRSPCGFTGESAGNAASEEQMDSEERKMRTDECQVASRFTTASGTNRRKPIETCAQSKENNRDVRPAH